MPMGLSVRALLLVSFCVQSLSEGRTPSDRDPDEAGARYINQWIVHVDGSTSDARAVARHRGFVYLRPVPGFEGYHLLRRPERITEFHAGHHQRLRRSSNVRWVQQEQVKVRKKRGLRFNDQMYPQQWYLREGASEGFDMNVRAAWDLGYTGKGVVVTILDDGLDYTHPDLKRNYDGAASFDINSHDKDPMPRETFDNENKHGTRCAGEVAATANNRLCNVGIAYNSRIGGVRMLDGDITDSVEGSSLSLNQNYIDIYSGSWGPDDNGKVVDGPGVMARSAFERGVRTGRKGLGNIFVWASGNGGSAHDSCACDGYAGSIYTLSVSSVSEHNRKPWYLEECASTLASTYSSGFSGDRMVVTTDLHHMCTDKHTGTSASAPMAAGIVALVLEANPRLTWRDVQYLTVITADPIPFKDASWITNGVGRKVSLLYGYGLMDAGKMAYLAPLWRRTPDLKLCAAGPVMFNKPIYGTTKVTATFVTDGCVAARHYNGSFESPAAPGQVLYVEQVLVYLNLTFTRRGQLKISLVSPAGTRSVLLPPRTQDTASGITKFDRWPLASVQFWGERAAGTWRLEVENVGASHNAGRLSSGKLMLFGVDQPPISLRPPPADSQPLWFHVDFSRYVLKDGPDRRKPPKTSLSNGRLLCHAQCVNASACSGPAASQCTACRSFKLATSSECVASCPVAFYPDPERLCRPCHLRCSACVGPGPNNCSACGLGSALLPAERRCLDVGQACPGGSYLAPGRICANCSAGCALCRSAGRCQACRQDNGTLVLSATGHCVRSCSPRHFVSSDKRCLPCVTECAACISGRPDGCISCPPDLLLLKTNRTAAEGHCVRTCPKGFFLGRPQRECYRCHRTCGNCRGPGPQNCTFCRPGLLLSSNRCIDPMKIACPKGHFLTGAICAPCHPSCLRCDGASLGSCLECANATLVLHDGRCRSACPAGLFGANVTSPGSLRRGLISCRRCAPNCAACAAPGSSDCLRCFPGANFIPVSAPGRGSCAPSCPVGRYKAGTVCEACPQPCTLCEGPTTCRACAPGFVLLDTRCVKSCPEGFGQEEGVCVRCPLAHCVRCSGPGLTSCLACKPPVILDITGKCTEGPHCPLREFQKDKACLKCHALCRSCSGPTPQDCLSCPLDSCLARSTCHPCCSSSPVRLTSPYPCANCSLLPDEPCLAPPGLLDSADASSPGLDLGRQLHILVIGLFVLILVLVVGFFLIFSAMQARSGQLRCACCDRTGGHDYSPLPQLAGSPDRGKAGLVKAALEMGGTEGEEEEEDPAWTVTMGPGGVTVRRPNGFYSAAAGDKNSDVSSGVGSSPDKSTDEGEVGGV